MIKVKRIIYLTIGFISLAFGIIGIVLPILPTTPFLLLTSFCFAKGSKRFNNWFKETKIYKNHLETFVSKRAMTLKQKITILLFADTMMVIPLILIESKAMKIGLILIILVKAYYFIFKIDTIKGENKIEKQVY